MAGVCDDSWLSGRVIGRSAGGKDKRLLIGSSFGVPLLYYVNHKIAYCLVIALHLYLVANPYQMGRQARRSQGHA